MASSVIQNRGKVVKGPIDGRCKRGFYERSDTVTLAKQMLGKRLVTVSRGVRTSGMIVEVEAYLGTDDPACHAARGMTERNRIMFESAGHCYVYLIYGMYHCVNVVSDPTGVGSAVLIRAIEPLEGTEVMARRRSSRRGVVKTAELARGPGRLCQALGITKSYSGDHLATSTRIWIEPHKAFEEASIVTSGRIGISAGGEMQLRFFVSGSPFVSGSRK